MNKTAKRFDRSKGTVYNLIKREKESGNEFVKELEQIKKQQTKSILEVLQSDNRLNNIIDNILDVLQDKGNVQNEFERKGFTGLNAVMGTIFDKALKYQQMQLEVKGGVDKDLMTDDGYESALKSAIDKIDPSEFISEESK